MAFDFYFAGSQCEEANQVMITLGANVLKSYVNDRKSIQEWFKHKQEGWKGKLLIDNGAFTLHRKGGTLDIDSYIDWLNSNIDLIDYAIALDDIPGRWGEIKTLEQIQNSPINTWNNYLYMIERVTQPQKLLPVFHMGESFTYLENMVNSDKLLSNYICISGNKELTNKQREEWYLKCFNIIRHSKRPNLKVHCLGSATLQNAEKYPFTSMDATSWIMAGANGNILTDNGAIYVGKSVNLTDSEITQLNSISKMYGFTAEQLITDYKARMVVNVNYLYKASQETTFKNKIKFKRRLF